MKRKLDYNIFFIQKKLAKILSAFIIKRHKRSAFHRKAMVLITKRYLRKYLYVINNLKGEDDGQIPKIIWVCWIQGFENAPKMIQACIESIKNHSREYTVNIITDENIKQFVDIPEYIY